MALLDRVSFQEVLATANKVWNNDPLATEIAKLCVEIQKDTNPGLFIND
jgi:hypothetical protein